MTTTTTATSTTTPARAAAALAAISAATFCLVLVELLPGGLITVIAPDLHTSIGRIGLLVSGYAGVVVVASVPLARATRRVPRRELLVGSLVMVAVSTAAAALATDYGVLFAARAVTAVAHSVFWAVAFPAATALFDPSQRGRVVARVSVGTALAPVAGLPLALWAAQRSSWRISFAVTAFIAVVIAIAVRVLLPARPAFGEQAGRGTQPNRAAFAMLLGVMFLVVAGSLAVFTYGTPYLLDVAGLDPRALSPVLVGVGVAGVAGMFVAGRVLDARPVFTQLGALVVLTLALVALVVGGARLPVAIAGLLVVGLCFPAFNVAVQYFTLHFAPGGTDVASATGSATFNLGTAAGTFAASFLVDAAGVDAVPGPAAALVAAAALGTVAMSRVSRA